ncbi:MAG TPA: glycosyltransferase family 39 protein [Candidatus Binataceae bacterium]|nr:glycosyltransferase family 39 protein [Candidatus Binataceae bacterium]
MASEALTDRVSGRALMLEAIAAFAVALAFLLALAPTAPFTKELGVCECGAVRDVLAGNVILPHYSPGTMVGTPPMYWWMAAVAVRLFGWNEFALRAPALLATAIAAAVLYAWLASTLNRRVAMWSVPILLSTQYIADAARQPRQDAVMMMFLVAALACLERALADGPRRKRLLTASALAMGGAILTKGPLGIALPGLAVTVFLATQGRILRLFSLDVILTFVRAVAIGAIWYLAALSVGGEAFYQFQIVHWIFRRFLGSAMGAVAECHNPVYYYFPRVIADFLPWSLFYPALGIMMWRKKPNLPASVSFALCWFAAVLGFFTLSAGKCEVYILSLFPALAAMTAWLVAGVINREEDAVLTRKAFDWASLAIAAGILAAMIAMVALDAGAMDTLIPHLHRSDRRYLEILSAAMVGRSPAVILWMTLWILGALLVFYAATRKRVFTQSVAIAAIALTGTVFWYGFMNPALAAQETLRPFAVEVDRATPPKVAIDYIGPFDCDVGFYSTREIGSVKSFQCHKPNADAFFIVWQDRLANFTAEQRACLDPVAESAPVDSHGARTLMIEKK